MIPLIRNCTLRASIFLCRQYHLCSSSSTSFDWLHLESELTGRRLPLHFDYLSPQPSHLLNLSLADFVPGLEPTCPQNASFLLPSVLNPCHMPTGHHLVYFPPAIPSSQLLPDGTDILHSPGHPFNRRMWAGGSIHFHGLGPLLNGQRAVCVEGIREMRIRGIEGDEMVFVSLERRVATVGEWEIEENIRSRVWSNEDDRADAAIIEKRVLVFMRDKTPGQIKLDRGIIGRHSSLARGKYSNSNMLSSSYQPMLTPSRLSGSSKVPLNPDFCHIITPTRTLLFRYSALTFNAHSIHLDKGYAQNVEGYPDTLVHGPLALTLLLTVFQTHASKLGQAVASVDYRNLAPLLVEQPLKICAKRKSGINTGSWNVWVEGNGGGLAVKGTIQTVEQ